MNYFMQINGQTTEVIDHYGKRVVTFNQIAQLHQIPAKQIRNNFIRNRKHFIEGMDFYEYAGVESIKIDLNLMSNFQLHGNTSIFFTETGYLMLVKSLTDDLSWKIQRMLVNNYFKKSVVDDLWIILPRLTGWISRLTKKYYSEEQIKNYILANYRVLEKDIKINNIKGITIKPVEVEDAN